VGSSNKVSFAAICLSYLTDMAKCPLCGVRITIARLILFNFRLRSAASPLMCANCRAPLRASPFRQGLVNFISFIAAFAARQVTLSRGLSSVLARVVYIAVAFGIVFCAPPLLFVFYPADRVTQGSKAADRRG
jgi:hypothetical protein